jgi:hypothetical protein
MSTGGKRCQPIVTSALLRSPLHYNGFCVSTVSIVCTSDHFTLSSQLEGLDRPRPITGSD